MINIDSSSNNTCDNNENEKIYFNNPEIRKFNLINNDSQFFGNDEQLQTKNEEICKNSNLKYPKEM